MFTADGKQATVKYDSSKKMFYIEWSGEEIPTTTRIVTGQNKVSVWSSTITVRAKEDFLGGNDILSNGNEAGQNQVYDPNNNYNPKKDFPKTTMNPKLLDLHLSHYEDTIFKGEEISPESLYDKLKTSKVQDDNDSKWFIDYLKRNSKKLKNNENYYIDVISGRSNPLNDNIVTFSKSDRTLTIEVPYYYLEVSGNNASYAGGTQHKNDKVGTLKYTWTMVDTGGNSLTDGDFRKSFTTATTADVKYKLEVKYTPDPIDYGSGDQYADNGTPRTLALTQQSGTDKLIRDPVGEEQTSMKSDKGIAVIHAVDGRIGTMKKMKREDFFFYLPDDGSVSFNFTIKRTYNGSAENYGSPVTITRTKSEIEALTADSDGDVVLGSEWIKDLPVGEYKVTEAVSDSEAVKLANIKAYTPDDLVSDS